jgi:hypothetical protein
MVVCYPSMFMAIFRLTKSHFLHFLPVFFVTGFFTFRLVFCFRFSSRNIVSRLMVTNLHSSLLQVRSRFDFPSICPSQYRLSPSIRAFLRDRSISLVPIYLHFLPVFLTVLCTGFLAAGFFTFLFTRCLRPNGV